MADQAASAHHRVTRRGVVTGVAAGAAATGLVACGSDDDAGGGSSDDSGSKAGGGGSEQVSVEKSKVPVGGGFVDEKAKVVVTQPKSGEFKAFSAVCTHEGCTVDQVKSNVIECPCHNSKFDGTTGEVTDGPAEKALPAKKVKADGEQLTVT